MSQPAHARPAARLAQRVSEMTPLFCEKVVFGGVVMSVARSELTPSQSSPPWMRDSASGPVDSICEASHEAAMSPMVSTEVTTKAMRMGMKAGG